MTEQNLQALAQAIGENSQVMMQNVHTTDQSTRAITECAGRLATRLDELSFEGDLGAGNNAGKIPFNIKVFSGEPREFETWIKQIEKHAFLFDCSDRKKQLVAYQTCTGLVSDYIKRYLESDGDKTWVNLKENLHSRFSPVLDRPKAFEQLVNTKQKKDEDVQFFAERLLSLAEKAYPDRTDSLNPIIESQLLSIFLSGLSDMNVRAQVERTMPHSFEEAYKIALREQGIVYRCATRNRLRPDRLDRPNVGQSVNQGHRPEQPMEIDHARRRHYQGGFKRSNDRRRNLDRQEDRKTDKHEIRCWSCSQTGHKMGNCPQNLN